MDYESKIQAIDNLGRNLRNNATSIKSKSYLQGSSEEAFDGFLKDWIELKAWIEIYVQGIEDDFSPETRSTIQLATPVVKRNLIANRSSQA